MKEMGGGLTGRLKVVSAGRGEYEQLCRFHYRDSRIGPYSAMYAIVDERARRSMLSGVVGVIVYRMPVPSLRIRNVATGGYFCGVGRSLSLALLNEHVRCISRVIIEPRYRGLGLGAWLVRETMGLQDVAMIESLAVMGRVHPFFERAGMTRFDPGPDAYAERMGQALEIVGIDRRLWVDSEMVYEMIERLADGEKRFVESEVVRFLGRYGKRRDMPPDIERTEYLLSKLGDRPSYFAWLNPAMAVDGLGVAGKS